MMPKIRAFINPPYTPRELLIILGALFIFLSIPLTLIAVLESRQVKPEAAGPKVSEVEITQKETLQLLSLNADQKTASPAVKKQILAKMGRVSETRKKRLASLMERNPQEVIKTSLPKKLSSAFPTTVQNNIEKEVNLSGKLEVLHIDDLVGKRTEFRYFLRSGKSKFSLHPTKDLGPINSGSEVKISGVKLGEKIAFDPKEEQNSKVLAAVAETTGEQGVAVILVNFQNDTSEPFSKTTATTTVFGTVNGYFKEASFNKTSLSGDVFGWYTLPIAKTCDYMAIRNEAIKAADPDIFFPGYSRIILGFPAACGWAGLGTVGKWSISTADGNISASIAWIVSSYFNLRVIGHEMGHNFGTYHANAWECGAKAVEGTCFSYEYADPYDIMGSASSGHFSAYRKERFGWFDPGNIKLVTSNTTVTIDPIELVSSNVQTVKVPKDKDVNGNPINYYYLEFRQQYGKDASLPGNVYNGALIRWAKYVSGGDTQLIDTTPNSQASDSLDRRDGALEVGKTFTDTSTGVTIKTLSKTADNITLEVLVGPVSCSRANPSVSISPAKVFATAGSTASFTVTVTNNDASVCGPSTFALSPTVPVGWTSSLGSSELAINAGSAASTTVNVTSPTAAAEGFYDFTLMATNQAEPAYKGTASATYVVSNDIEDPTVAITSPLSGATVSGTTIVSANASDDVGVTKVEFSVDGSLKSTDTTAPYSFSWDTTKETNGAHTLSAKAYDAAAKVGSSVPVAVTVSNLDTQAPSIPVGLKASVISETQVNLSWNASTDNVAVSSYKVFRDGLQIGNPTTTSFADNTVSLGKTYQYAVSALDFAGNESAKSSPVSVTIPDLTQPSVPSGLSAKVVSSTRVDLSWNASSDNVGVVGYRVYRDGSLIKATASRSYSDTAVSGGKTYSYQVAAYDSAGNISAKSASVKATTPSGTPQAIPGDLNGDGKVNIFDLSILLSRWGTTNKVADLNNSGRVDIFDLSILLSRWGS